MEDIQEKKYDVLVIGAGAAGMRAAIAASDEGANVCLVSKSLLGKAHTVMAEGGAAAAPAAAPAAPAQTAVAPVAPAPVAAPAAAASGRGGLRAASL